MSDANISEAMALVAEGRVDEAIDTLERSIGSGLATAEGIDMYLLLCDDLERPGGALDMLCRLLVGETAIEMDSAVEQHALAELAVRLDHQRESCSFSTVIQRLIDALLTVPVANWSLLERADIRAQMANALTPTAQGFDVAAGLLFVPESLEYGDIAAQTLELAACRPGTNTKLRRDAERVLHAAGFPEAAYRVERMRTAQTDRIARDRAVRSADDELMLDAVTVAVAGGHSAFRSMVRSAIEAAGGQMTEIPPSFEAVRRERAIVGALQRADVGVIVTSQIAHSTSDQVVKAAGRLGTPVLRVNSASVGAILQTLANWQLSVTDAAPRREDA